jgi:hypothetical protein
MAAAQLDDFLRIAARASLNELSHLPLDRFARIQTTASGPISTAFFRYGFRRSTGECGHSSD